LTLAIYQITAAFPREEPVRPDESVEETLLLDSSQSRRRMRQKRRSRIRRFCSIAMGSASELEYHLLLAKDLKLIKLKDYAELSQRAIEVKRMLAGLLQKLRAVR
jgi:hypothetical protein